MKGYPRCQTVVITCRDCQGQSEEPAALQHDPNERERCGRCRRARRNRGSFGFSGTGGGERRSVRGPVNT